MKRFRVRFHLGKGKNYMMWQVRDRGLNKSGVVATEYYDPDKVDIVMSKCLLGNQVSAARKIFEGANKTVCAWVDCDMIDVLYHTSPTYESEDVSDKTQYKYNPRKNPHWFTDTNFNCDGEKMPRMLTKGRNIYA